MNAQAPVAPRLHPLVATAAVAVTALSLVGIAAITGVLPAGKAETAPAGALALPASTAAPTRAAAVPPAPTFSMPPASAAGPARIPVKPVVKTVVAPKSAPVPAPAPVAETIQPPAPLQVATTPLASSAAEPPAPPPCPDCGVIDNVRAVAQPGEASGLGAVIGGVAGGLLGSQIGGGNGRKLAAVLGAAGGAYAGHQFEKSRNPTTRYEIDVRMTDGTLRTLAQNNAPAWRIGDRVRIAHGALVADTPSRTPMAPVFTGSHD